MKSQPGSVSELRGRSVDPVQLMVAGAAGVVASQLMRRVWRRVTGTAPPEDPARADVRVQEAVAWTATVGLAIAISRLLAGRAAYRILK